MNFDLDDDDLALRDGVRQLCRGRFPVATLRATGGRVERSAWEELGGAGVFALCLDEDAGGTGMGVSHAAVVFEELGAGLVHGPLVDTHLAAGLVEGAADGAAVVGIVEPGKGPVVLPHLEDLDAVLLLRDDGVARLEVGDLDARKVARPLDPLTPVHTVAALPAGTRLADAERASELRRRRTVLHAAQLVGLAAGATDLAVAYAGEREQFGRPIGGFQAVKHLCADMLTRVEVARVQVHAAAVALDDPGVAQDLGGIERTVAGAALLAGDAAVRNSKDTIQIHGGMGFTWEVDAHLFVKRAAALTALTGGTDAHEQAVADALSA